MRITLLGTGAAFADPDRAQSGILITLDNGRHYLFDCGAGITRNMVRANVSPADVTAVFLTHLHHDHICDFPLFVITGWMRTARTRPSSSVPGARSTSAATCSRAAPSRPTSSRAATTRAGRRTWRPCGRT